MLTICYLLAPTSGGPEVVTDWWKGTRALVQKKHGGIGNYRASVRKVLSLSRQQRQNFGCKGMGYLSQVSCLGAYLQKVHS